MADSEDFHILCLHETHANATKVDSALECESSSDGTVSNKLRYVVDFRVLFWRGRNRIFH